VRSLVGSTSGEWDNVLSEAEFAELIEYNLTHHFRVAQKISLVDGAQLVLVTQSTTSKSTAEEYALANFIKTSLHAFTATLGVESERVVHNVPVNQVDLARRARTEEPRNTDEEAEELLRFVNAVLLTSAPQTDAKESRYRSRIYRGNAITV
jgi:malonyl-CoA reductase/3-hydroxypropionate dehydrogenase (NADP+)